MRKKEKTLSLNERLLECVDADKMVRTLKDEGLVVPPSIEKEILGMLRLIAAKYAPNKSAREPLKFSELSKALRPVMKDAAFKTLMNERQWLIAEKGEVPFIRGWTENIYGPQLKLPQLPTVDRMEEVLNAASTEGVLAPFKELDLWVPRSKAFRKGTYANIVFELVDDGYGFDCSELKLNSSREPVKPGRKRVSVSSEDLASALLLLGKTGVETVHVLLPPLILLCGWKGGPEALGAFVIFSEWTNLLGPLPGTKSRKN